ncbi:MAG TPA: hypothetical protein V6C81_07990 [Planktothrix sp.]|jgi:hypothetical protein
MRKLSLLPALLVAALVALPVQSKQTLINGQVNHDNTRYLTSNINWYHSLGQAEQQAMHSGKMILWIQMLGSMDGAT